MKKLLTFLALWPALLYAQLDRVRMDMSELDFVKAFPEASREYEAESFWLNAWDTIEGTAGNSMWRILADTVTQYNFRSPKVNGPSYRFPDVDSVKVHNMRVSARQLTLKLKKYYGEPSVVQEKKIVVAASEPGTNDGVVTSLVSTHDVYFAQWNFSDGRIISVIVSAQVPLIKSITPAHGITAGTETSEQYEFTVTVTRSSTDLPWKFQVGRGVTEMSQRNPRLQAVVSKSLVHIYTFPDKELSGTAGWKFVFQKNTIINMQYYTANGLYYGDQSTEGSYSQCKYRAEKLIAEGQKSLGKPDSMYNVMTPEYNPFNMETKYQYPYLYAEWRQAGGTIYLIFDELGGGKEGVRFSVRINYPVLN